MLHHLSHLTFLHLFLPLVLAGFSVAARAAIVTVGTPVGVAAGQCTCGTIQCAFDYAHLTGDPNVEIRLTRSLTYYDENDTFASRTGENITITGGFATCDQAVNDNSATAISGATLGGTTGKAREPVLRIETVSQSSVSLRFLQITKGDNYETAPAIGYGGGLNISGGGKVELADMSITGNKADVGGGIYATGNVVIGANVTISGNTATYNGGGVALIDGKLDMLLPGSIIAFNEALGASGTGYGGGLLLAGDGDRGAALAKITAGSGNLGSIYSNTAVYGGGVALLGNGGFAYLQLIGDDATVAVRDNFASARGGGAYLKPDVTNAPLEIWPATVVASNVHIDNNAAPDGAAIYLDIAEDFFGDNFGASWTMTGGTVSGNIAMDDLSTITNGAIIHVGDDPASSRPSGNLGLRLTRVSMRDNSGGPLVRNDGYALIDTALLATNSMQSHVLQSIGSDGKTDLYHITLTANSVGAGQVLAQSADMLLQDSILYQPGKTSLLHGGGTFQPVRVIAGERNSLDGGNSPNVYQGDPRFIDPAWGDYGLRAAAPGIDWSSGSGKDIWGQAPVDIPFRPNANGFRDAGAIERPALQPLVLDHHFSTDLHLWPPTPGFLPNPATYVGNETAVADGSGAVLVKIDPSFQTLPPDGRVLGPHQCVNLPSPGDYALNGFGRSPGTSIATRDYARLEWKLYANSETCTGATIATGGVTLSSGGWGKAPTPALIIVPQAQWTGNTTLDITLVALEGNASASNSIDAYFDEITLDLIGEDTDQIFVDSFES